MRNMISVCFHPRLRKGFLRGDVGQVFRATSSNCVSNPFPANLVLSQRCDFAAFRGAGGSLSTKGCAGRRRWRREFRPLGAGLGSASKYFEDAWAVPLWGAGGSLAQGGAEPGPRSGPTMPRGRLPHQELGSRVLLETASPGHCSQSVHFWVHFRCDDLSRCIVGNGFPGRCGRRRRRTTTHG